ncbi:valine--tRNA ligase-like [Cydia amplana]|uniref:valine--tRNA ligase-like n=1 Tax=Cydia amplana TaxID=1869771 RepID=UPI002FE5451D
MYFRHNTYNCIKSYLCFLSRNISKTSRIIPKPNLSASAYQPAFVEKHVYQEWERNGLFTPENFSDKPSFSMVLPPPNVTGKLHLGHALAGTVQDVIVRRKRATGHNVLWLPGTDHAGIATQGVVEKYLKSRHNLTRHELGRDKFNKEVWKWKEKHGNTICQQLRTMGYSLDWGREMFTMDRKHINAVNKAFIRLFQKGLIYRQKALVNWCNTLQSTVSDIEVDNMEITGPTELRLPGYNEPVKFGQLYDVAYRICDSTEEVVVSTTMPETILGDVAVAVHPDDPRYKHLGKKRVFHPFNGITLPIIFDDFVDMKFGTGAVKITPAHSKIDYEVAKQHKLQLHQVIDEQGYIINSKDFNGLKKYQCREEIVKRLDGIGLLKKVTPHSMTLPICSRTNDVIEYLPKEQWFLNCSSLNKKAMDVVEKGELKIQPEKFVKNWMNWCKDDRDWCVSRQLWWGQEIPGYKCSYASKITWVAANDENEAKDIAAKLLDTEADRIQVEKDTDVLDTWFSSAIYPFSSLGWPDKYSLDYDKFYPLNLMATGHDILGLWVHRMVILGFELTDNLPFRNVLLHGIICDNKGSKMSKSKGNVIDPIDVINGISLDELKKKTEKMYGDGILSKSELVKSLEYHKSNFSNTKGIPECGVDALRFTLLSQDIKSHFVNFDVNMCHSNKLFCNKIWQSVKYTHLQFAKLKELPKKRTILENDLTFFDAWILSRLAHMIDIVNTSMENHDYHLATKALRTFIYNEFCDVYLETTKPGFEHKNLKIGYAHAHTLSTVLNASLRCLNPFMIYLTYDLIPRIPQFEESIIYNFNDYNEKYYKYPQPDEFRKWRNINLETQVDQFLSAIFLVRQLKGYYNISNKLRPTVCINTTNNVLKADINKYNDIVKNLTKCDNIQFGEVTNKNFVSGQLDEDTKIYVELLGKDIDLAMREAKTKLMKKVNKLEDYLAKLEQKMSSPNYVNLSEFTRMTDRENEKSKREELMQLKRLVVDDVFITDDKGKDDNMKLS